MAFDSERARRDTPGVARVAHLNNAGAALPPAVVTEAVIAHLRLEAELGGYEAADAARGQVKPAEEVGAVARAAGVPFLLDACQSAGQLPLDVERIGCDMLSATGRKFLRGPRGTGFLYVRREMLDSLVPPFLDLHAAAWTSPGSYEIRGDARRFENWETNYAAKIGLGTAVDYALSWGLDAIEERVTALAEGLRERLRDINGVTVHDQGLRRCAIVTFTVDGVPAAEISRRLTAQHINTSVSSASSALFDMPGRGLTEVVRASVHYYNTDAELDRLAGVLAG